MIPNRESSAEKPNEELREVALQPPADEVPAGEPPDAAPEGSPTEERPAEDTEEAHEALGPVEPSAGGPEPPEAVTAAATIGNAAWFERCELREGILLLGGSSLADVRIRFAQSQLRADLTPSRWSLCGLIGADGSVDTVPLQPADVSAVPATNAVRRMAITDFDDPAAWPNIAVLRFAEKPEVVRSYAEKVAQRRTIIDLPELLLAWLAYAWAAGGGENPLVGGQGVPSAAYVETSHSLAGIELAPGLSSAASCPEAIWQAVRWWHEYYEGVAEVGAGEAGAVRPSGYYLVRQPAAAVHWVSSEATGGQVRTGEADQGGGA